MRDVACFDELTLVFFEVCSYIEAVSMFWYYIYAYYYGTKLRTFRPVYFLFYSLYLLHTR